MKGGGGMIRIGELYRLKTIGSLRLIAGKEGLERTVTAAVLFEYDPSRMQLPDFYKGDLVVTTLAYARGEEQLIAPSLLALLDQGIAGLLVKTAYFGELPAAVVDAADRLGTPLFLFDETYIEEVIVELTDLIRGRRRFVGFENELNTLMAPNVSEAQAKECLAHIDPVGAPCYRVYTLYAKERMPGLDERIDALLNADVQTAKRFICMEWRRMVVILCHIGADAEQEDAVALIENFLKRVGVVRSALCVGVSRTSGERAAFPLRLKEAVYAARAASLEGRLLLTGEELGLYAYLFPMSENAFVCDQCRRSLACIREYDEQNHTNLERTAEVYVAERMEIAAAAKALYQHPNTVRYRLSKIQKLMALEDDALFAPMISLMVSLTRILGEGERT